MEKNENYGLSEMIVEALTETVLIMMRLFYLNMCHLKDLFKIFC